MHAVADAAAARKAARDLKLQLDDRPPACAQSVLRLEPHGEEPADPAAENLMREDLLRALQEIAHLKRECVLRRSDVKVAPRGGPGVRAPREELHLLILAREGAAGPRVDALDHSHHLPARRTQNTT